jgi:hypothetical protein
LPLKVRFADVQGIMQRILDFTMVGTVGTTVHVASTPLLWRPVRSPDSMELQLPVELDAFAEFAPGRSFRNRGREFDVCSAKLPVTGRPRILFPAGDMIGTPQDSND